MNSEIFSLDIYEGSSLERFANENLFQKPLSINLGGERVASLREVKDDQARVLIKNDQGKMVNGYLALENYEFLSLLVLVFDNNSYL
jgi:hypothetical protein